MEPADETFEKLEVWRRSHVLSIEIYRLLADCRDRGFKDQITRSANSISDNIAEGAERLGKAEFRPITGCFETVARSAGWAHRPGAPRRSEPLRPTPRHSRYGPKLIGKWCIRQFLGYAKGSAGEARSQVLRALALNYLPVESGRRLTVELRGISRMIHGLIDSLDR